MMLRGTLILTVALYATAGIAGLPKSAYLTDILYVPLRSGQGSNDPVVVTLKSGDPLDVLEEDGANGMIHVKTKDGKEGWLKNRYITDKKIAREELDAARKKLETIESSQGSVKDTVDTLKTELTGAKTATATLTKENSELKSELSRIKAISGQTAELDSKNRELTVGQKSLLEKIETLTTANTQLTQGSRNEGIKLGISAIVFGLLIGVVLSHVKPPKRREGTLRLR